MPVMQTMRHHSSSALAFLCIVRVPDSHPDVPSGEQVIGLHSARRVYDRGSTTS
ncbi:hypothetical protein JOD67_006408 [Tenggerimyces flavus]|nr:hypothetical protein [Tenggerimyces flavus]